jgi:hypothetical protein
LKNIPTYDTELIQATATNRLYLFESNGEKEIIKLIEYAPVKRFEGRTVYNLGFGDLDEASGTILDGVNSNNGDVYTVFNTVLSTVPLFFADFPNAVIMVGGSDGHEDFKTECLPTCRKRCTNHCKNFQRRTRTYRNFVDKYFDELCKDYIFFGRIRADGNVVVQYSRGNEYDEILVYKKK